jgi:hypothetical protein
MPDDSQNWLARSRAHSAAGDHLLAYDVALRGLSEHPGDPGLEHAAVLALARSGATEKARERYAARGLGSIAPDRVERSLYTDIAALGARIAKDLALAAGRDRRTALLREAVLRYRRIFDDTGGYYPGVNAATLALLAGDEAQARALAALVSAVCARRTEGGEGGYYLWASLAEASLVAGDEAAAAAALAEAGRAGDAARRGRGDPPLAAACLPGARHRRGSARGAAGARDRFLHRAQDRAAAERGAGGGVASAHRPDSRSRRHRFVCHLSESCRVGETSLRVSTSRRNALRFSTLRLGWRQAGVQAAFEVAIRRLT